MLNRMLNHGPSDSNLRWYQGLDRYCWTVLIIAALGWLFDTMDQSLFNMVRAPSLSDLFRAQFTDAAGNVNRPALAQEVTSKIGLITAIFMLGWATGGFLFGIVGDRIGRTRTMMFTILIYAIFTGLSGLAQSFWPYAITRFITGMGVGGEFAAGAALVAETFPSRSRPMALGFLQSLSTVGNTMAAVITLIIGDLEIGRWELFGHQFAGWRIAYFIGAVPALLVLWIRSSVKEPEEWKLARANTDPSKQPGRIRELFSNPIIRRNVLVGTLLGTAGVGALWGVAFFSIDMLRKELIGGGMNPKLTGRFMSVMFIVQQAGTFFGLYLFAVFAEKVGRRAAFFLWFALAWASILAFFWALEGSGQTAYSRSLILAPVLGFCTLGPFAGFAIYFPELFPTRLRATGCGFCYNFSRYLAAIAPLALGKLAISLNGYAAAATVVSTVYILGFIGAWLGPETKGKPLPADQAFEINGPAFPVVVTAGKRR
jgi:MFS family permease